MSSSKDPTKGHRHDVGAVAHGPEYGASTTRSIQVLLGICITLSTALLLYTVGRALLS